MQFGLNCAKEKQRTHTCIHASTFCSLCHAWFPAISAKTLVEFYFIFLRFFLEFFAFLFAVCLARILIIGNKFVFNSTTLRTKHKSWIRGRQEGGAEINVAYALQMMEPGGASTSWLDALLSARASTTDRWVLRVYVWVCVYVCCHPYAHVHRQKEVYHVSLLKHSSVQNVSCILSVLKWFALAMKFDIQFWQFSQYL